MRRMIIVALLCALSYAQTDVLCPVCGECPEGMRPVDYVDDSGCLSCDCATMMDPTADPTEERPSTDAVVKFTTTISGGASARRNWDKTQDALAKSMSVHYGLDESMFRFSQNADSRRLLQDADELVVDVEIGPFETIEEADEIVALVESTPVSEVNTSFVNEMSNEGIDDVSVASVGTVYSDVSDDYGMDPTADPTEYRPVDPTEGPDSFYVGDMGSVCNIESLVMGEYCESAAIALGLPFVLSTPAELWAGTYGCIAADNNGEMEVYFNTYQDGSAMDSIAPVCSGIILTPEPEPFFEVFGDCEAVDNCVQSANYPDNHGNMQGCSVTMLRDAVVTIGDPFELETCCDNLIIRGVDVESAAEVPEMFTAGESFHWSSDFSITSGGWQLCFSDYVEPVEAATYVKFSVSLDGMVDNESWDNVESSLKKSMSEIYGVREDMISLTMATLRRKLQALTVVEAELGPYTEEEAAYVTDTVNNTPVADLSASFGNDLATNGMTGVEIVEVAEADSVEGCPACECEVRGSGGMCDVTVCASCMFGTTHCTACYDGYELYFDHDTQAFSCQPKEVEPCMDSVAPSVAPTALYALQEYNYKCPTSSTYRTFKLDWTTDENCAIRCENDAQCNYFSTGANLCIGCTHLPSSLPNSFSWLFWTFRVNSAVAQLPTQSPTPSPTFAYSFLNYDTKCPSSDRSFKLDYTSLENCVSRCQLDSSCAYISIASGFCIGCTVEATTYHNGATSYYVFPEPNCEHDDLEAQVDCLTNLVGHYELTCEV